MIRHVRLLVIELRIYRIGFKPDTILFEPPERNFNVYRKHAPFPAVLEIITKVHWKYN
jgi:hypothetical protein